MHILSGDALHGEVIEEQLLKARHYVWLATADLKDMHVRRGRRYVPILELFDDLASRGVTFRIVHAKLPSQPFRSTLEKLPRLSGGAMELQICSRSHWKMAIIDGSFAYLGSANFTGAGLGARSATRRNLEVGLVSSEPQAVATVAKMFDEFWMGAHCEGCGVRDRCPDPIR